MGATKEDIEVLAKDLFHGLPNFYTKQNDQFQYTNIDDAMDSVTQVERITIARYLRDGLPSDAGRILGDALMRVCRVNATDKLENE